jgi:hypothetical protein
MNHNDPHPLKRQVGGSHYAGTAIQHVTFCQRNRIPWCEANAIKYVLRHRRKNGRQDLEKAMHYLELLIDEEYIRDGANPPPYPLDLALFEIAPKDFLNANSVPERERIIVIKILNHQRDHGESNLRAAMGLIRDLMDTYGPEDPGLDLL